MHTLLTLNLSGTLIRMESWSLVAEQTNGPYREEKQYRRLILLAAAPWGFHIAPSAPWSF